MTCAGCGTENPSGAKFCNGCGASLSPACPVCGTSNVVGARFCNECGSPLDAEVASKGSAARPVDRPSTAEAAPAAERRLVTVLFADLVGFTTLSESRDAEDVRDLLSRYFDTCRRLIGLYGGTVEKFIGDAVMAVWGTPTATEDDAERAVRAALDLVASVSALGQEVGAEGLRARAGVLTGEAAVTLGAEGQGMVAGDLVNTASRVQSAAEPGCVFVGESTRRATEHSIVYEDAGTFELKGKEGMTPLWKAMRVVSGVRGTLKSQGLEAPFVGRDRELRQIKDLFHVCAEEKRAQLVSVTGIAGIGKSRLAWEFYKYFDGITQLVYWHRGRCLAYGEGVTYWALADMVRWRCRIAEDEPPASALAKLRSALEEHILDPEERAFIEPRLAHLLGLGGDHESHERQDLFAAWRLFFERLADSYPTVLAFEDMQWADASLLDFIEYLLDWSRNSPLYVITLARPELLERRPNWGAGHRNFASLYLDPLTPEAMEELLTGLVPGLPSVLREQILVRAEGVPLYAMETVRMLLDRGGLVQKGSVYRPVGTIDELEVPETLHALIAARLDGLSPEERRLLEDGAVLGKTFTRSAIAALTAHSAAELDSLLRALVRKEVLSLQSDPRSPEHGQYGFLQDLVRHVAYETLSKRERRARHLAAAEHLTSALAEDEVAEVVASHLVEAYKLDPDADDAYLIKERARLALVAAGERARSLGAAAEAQRYFEQAARLADEPAQQAELLGRAGTMAGYAGEPDRAQELIEESIAIYEAEGDTHAAARASARLGRVLSFTDRRDEARARLEHAFDVISGDEPDEDLAMLAAMLSRNYWFGGDLERAATRAELALDIAETQRLPEALAFALRAKGAVLYSRGHGEEAFALMKHSLEVALEHELLEHASTTYFILSDRCFRRDEYSQALIYLDESLALARKLGSRPNEWAVLAERTYPLLMLGRWDEVAATCDNFTQEQVDSGGVVLSLLDSGVEVHVHRGELNEARRIYSMFSRLEHSTDLQDRCTWLSATAALRRGEGRFEEAVTAGVATIEAAHVLGTTFQSVKHGVVDAIEAALALGHVGRALELLEWIDSLPIGGRPPFLSAQAQRLRARIANEPAGLESAAGLFRDLETPYALAVTLLEHAELTSSERSLVEAREIFDRLGASRWLERAATADRKAQPTVA
jgi:class 3 adenylate cyclase/tetratricopeptide (TPR) repeat protein